MARRRRRRVRDPLAALTAPQLERQASTRAGAVMAPERRAIMAERERAATRAEQARLSTQQMGDSVAAMLRDLAGRADDPYIDASRELGAISGGYLEGLGERLRATPGMEGIENQLNVMRELGSINPREHLLTLGANARTYAEGQPAVAAKATQESVMAMLRQSGIEDAEYGQKLIDLAAKYPQVRAELMDALRKFELEKRAQRLYERQFGLKEKEFQYERERQRSEFALQLEELRAEGEQVDAAASKAVGYFVDQYGKPILDASGNVIKTKSDKTGGSGKATPYQKAVQEAREVRGKPIAADELAEGRYVARPGAKGVFPDGSTNDPKKARYENDMSFAEVVDYLMGAYGLKRKQARRAAIAAGLRPDGKRPKKKSRGD